MSDEEIKPTQSVPPTNTPMDNAPAELRPVVSVALGSVLPILNSREAAKAFSKDDNKPTR